jgi:signal transduction histidine kinase
MWYRTEIPGEVLIGVRQPAVLLGRISDADETYFNGTLIGTTGIVGSSIRFVPHRDRVYLLPRNLIGTTNTVAIRAHKFAADVVGMGVRTGDVRVGEFTSLSGYAFKRYAVRTLLPLGLAIIILVFGVYHLFLFLYVPSRVHYLTLGGCMTFFAVFAACYSFWPYEFSDHPRRILFFHGVGSFWGLYFFGRFIVTGPSRAARYLHRAQLVIASVFTLWVATATDFDEGLKRYFSWYVVLIPSILGYFVHAIVNLRKGGVSRFAAITTGAFIVALIYDVTVTLGGVQGEQWSIPTFMFVLAAGGLVLGRDFAQAYSDVEATVVARTRDLAIANERLRGLEQMKSRFLGNVSHDFKTSIAIAVAHIEDAKASAISTAKQALGAAETALNTLHALVLDFLDTLKAESAELKLKWESVSVGRGVRAWAAPYQILCRKKDLALVLSLSVDDALKVPMDVARMERVFGNLLLNALKFTREGRITVGLRSDASRLYLEVADTGPGVPEQEREMIFERYYQGSHTSLRDHGGSGIGLSFVREVVEAHNGQVWVEAPAEGGARFVVALPLSQDVEITGEYLVADIDGRVGPPNGSVESAYPDPGPETYRPECPSVLVVEDNSEMAQIVVRTLGGPYNVYFAKDGIDALEHLKNRKLDCIVSDIMMPRLDGKGLLMEVKKNVRWRVIPFVCLTSLTETEILVECLNLGANNYVTKPFRREVLLATVSTLIENTVFREQLVAKEKLAALGLLSAGLAHEIRNPVHSAKNAMEGLRRVFQQLEAVDFADREQALGQLEGLAQRSRLIQESFQDAQACVSRIHQITDAIGSYATGATELGNVDLVRVMAQVLRIIEGKRKERGVSITFDNDRQVHVHAFPSIHQAFMNVVDNAIDAASAGGGRVEIHIQETAEGAEVRVADNGPGIPLHQQPHVFDAFFTAKGPGKGAGLGLYITRAIVEFQHRGTIGFHCEERRGATFVLKLKKSPDLAGGDMLDFKGVPIPI